MHSIDMPHAMHKLLKGMWVGCWCGSLLSLPSRVGGFWLVSSPPRRVGRFFLQGRVPSFFLCGRIEQRQVMSMRLAPVGRVAGVAGVVAVR